MTLTVVSNGITLKQTEAVITLEGRYLKTETIYFWKLNGFEHVIHHNYSQDYYS